MKTRKMYKIIFGNSSKDDIDETGHLSNYFNPEGKYLGELESIIIDCISFSITMYLCGIVE